MAKAADQVAESFAKYFRVQIVEDPENIAKTQYVRYRVYCEEFGFEPLDRFPDQKERDDFDASSTHCLITHLPSGEPAGCVRMVPVLAEDPSSQLPMEKFCGTSLDLALLDEMDLDRNTVCEASRLAVDRNFRRRPKENETRFGCTRDFDFSEEERRTLPFIAISAYLAVIAVAVHSGRNNMFAVMEPFLPRLLSRVGIHFSRVGEDMDYHGTRAAYHLDTGKVLNELKAEFSELYGLIETQIYP